MHPAIDPLEVENAAEHPADVASEGVEEADIDVRMAGERGRRRVVGGGVHVVEKYPDMDAAVGCLEKLASDELP